MTNDALAIEERKNLWFTPAGYVPEGLKRLSELWSAPVPDYAFKGWDKGVKSCIAYIISGLLGVAVVVGCTYLLAKK